MKGMLPYTRAEEERKRLAREEEARKRPSWAASVFSSAACSNDRRWPTTPERERFRFQENEEW